MALIRSGLVVGLMGLFVVACGGNPSVNTQQNPTDGTSGGGAGGKPASDPGFEIGVGGDDDNSDGGVGPGVDPGRMRRARVDDGKFVTTVTTRGAAATRRPVDDASA